MTNLFEQVSNLPFDNSFIYVCDRICKKGSTTCLPSTKIESSFFEVLNTVYLKNILYMVAYLRNSPSIYSYTK